MNSSVRTFPSISLVLIVRNEADNVSDLLSELTPVYDEAIVVDTGSTDRTIEVARTAGATVVHFEWCDDFARARNHGIAAAGGDWILTIDADERIAASDYSRIRNATNEASKKCYVFTQRNYTNMSGHPEWRLVNGDYPAQEVGLNGYVEAYQVRLFPNRHELRYQGCIHETVCGHEAAGVEKTPLDVTIHHYGHLRAGDIARQRNDLYSRLTREKLRSNPDDGNAHLQMATRYVEEGRPEQARHLLEKLAETVQQDDPVYARGHLMLGRILSTAGELSLALTKFKCAAQLKPEWMFCWVEVISTLASLGRWTEMSRYLTQAGGLFPDEPLLWKLECRLLVATGEYEAAANRADLLSERFPDWLDVAYLADKCRAVVEREHKYKQEIMQPRGHTVPS